MALQDRVILEKYAFDGFDYKEIEKKSFTFFTSQNHFSGAQSITENSNWRIRFSGASNDRLYIDGLDLLSSNLIKNDDEGFLYINPSERPLCLYDHKRNDHKYLPGKYRLKLVKEDGSVQFSWLEINAKYMSDNQLVSMREDIENTVIGLARSFDANTNGSVTDYDDVLGATDLSVIELLHQEYTIFFRALYRIGINPQSVISNRYCWMRQEKKPLDMKGIQYMSAHSIRRQNHDIYGKNHYISFNNNVNTNLKNNLLFLEIVLKHLNEKIKSEFIFLRKRDVNFKSKDLEKDFHMIKSCMAMVVKMLTERWMRSVDNNQINTNTLSSFMNSDYLFVQNLVSKIKREQHRSVAFHRQYVYYWHRTDLLYEIWGYIKVLDSLKKLNFQPISGWIFDKNRTEYEPLSPGTIVRMNCTKFNGTPLHVDVVYNKRITADRPAKADDKLTNPLWCNTRKNAPDVRLDIRDAQNTLISVIILDTKYRKLKDVVGTSKNGCWQQIASYSDSIKSPFRYKSKRYQRLLDLNFIDNQQSAVSAVSVLYPGIPNSKAPQEKIKEAEEKNVYPIEIRPGKGSQDLVDFFRKKIGGCAQDIINRADILKDI